MDRPLLWAPHERNVKTDPQVLSNKQDPSARIVCGNALNRDVAFWEVTESTVFSSSMHNARRADRPEFVKAPKLSHRETDDLDEQEIPLWPEYALPGEGRIQNLRMFQIWDRPRIDNALGFNRTLLRWETSFLFIQRVQCSVDNRIRCVQ